MVLRGRVRERCSQFLTGGDSPRAGSARRSRWNSGADGIVRTGEGMRGGGSGYDLTRVTDYL